MSDAGIFCWVALLLVCPPSRKLQDLGFFHCVHLPSCICGLQHGGEGEGGGTVSVYLSEQSERDREIEMEKDTETQRKHTEMRSEKEVIHEAFMTISKTDAYTFCHILDRTHLHDSI